MGRQALVPMFWGNSLILLGKSTMRRWSLAPSHPAETWWKNTVLFNTETVIDLLQVRGALFPSPLREDEQTTKSRNFVNGSRTPKMGHMSSFFLDFLVGKENDLRTWVTEGFSILRNGGIHHSQKHNENPTRGRM